MIRRGDITIWILAKPEIIRFADPENPILEPNME